MDVAVAREIRRLKQEIRELKGSNARIRLVGEVHTSRQRITSVGSPKKTTDAAINDTVISGAAPIDAPFVTTATDSRLTGEKVLGVSSPVTKTVGTSSVVIGSTAGSGGTGTVFVIGETPGGTGVNRTLANIPTSAANVALYVDGQKLRKVASSPGPTEYTITGTAITLGRAVDAGSWIVADYLFDNTGKTPVFEDLTTTGTSFTLSQTPATADAVAVYLNGQRLRKVASGPGPTEYTISAATITTGHTLSASDTLEAIYVPL